MKNKKIIFISLAILIIWNILLLLSKNGNDNNDNHNKFSEFTKDFRYKRFPVENIDFLDNKEEKIYNGGFNLYLLFSMQECQACLKKQLTILKNYSKKYKGFLNIYAVSVDPSKLRSAYIFKKTYNTGLNICYLDKSIGKFLKTDEVPFLFFTTRENIILDLNVPETRYYSNKNFYKNVELILNNVKSLKVKGKNDQD